MKLQKAILTKIVAALSLTIAATQAHADYSSASMAPTLQYIASPSIEGLFVYTAKDLSFNLEIKQDWSDALPMERTLPEPGQIIVPNAMGIQAAAAAEFIGNQPGEILPTQKVSVKTSCGNGETSLKKYEIQSETARGSNGLLEFNVVNNIVALGSACSAQVSASKLIESVKSYSVSSTLLVLKMKDGKTISLKRK